MAETYYEHHKKLIACCDGTWMNSDKGFVKGSLFSGPGHLQTPSNVTRIGRAILSEDRNRHPQVVYYQSGVGSGSTMIERLIGGGTGEGIGEHVREAYSFLANNYAAGDSIFLLGFSRGAFTARCVGGLIGALGLLEKEGLPYFYLIFKDWENAGVASYEPVILTAIPDFHIAHPPHKIEDYLSSYRDELLRRGLTRNVEIQAIGVWDTVGALGIPTPALFQRLGLPDFLHEYKFLDTTIDDHVKYAFHALALDEQRASYGPTIWEKPPGGSTILKQVWFPGVHSNVGGSYDDTGIADITLAWMMDSLSPWIDFNPNYIRDQTLLNAANDSSLIGKPRGWAMGKIYDSCKFPTSLSGREPRTPCLNRRVDYFTGRETDTLLSDTNEKIHPSVRVRILGNGKGYEDEGIYAPEALEDWEMERYGHRVSWVYRGGRGRGMTMEEEELGQFELELLKLDPVAAGEVLGS